MNNTLIEFSEADLNKLFPYFIIWNSDLVLETLGKKYYKLFPDFKTLEDFTNQFEIQTSAVSSFNVKTATDFSGKNIVFIPKEKKSISVAGQFEYLKAINKYVFFGNKLFDTTQQKKKIESIFAQEKNDFFEAKNDSENGTLESVQKDLISYKRDNILFKDLLNGSSDAVQVALENGDLKFINLESSKRLGIPMNEVENYNVFDFEKIFRDDHSVWFRHVEDLKANVTLLIEGLNLNRETGTNFPVEVTAKYIKSGGVGYVVAISRDISERKLNEKKLKLQEEKYRNIISNMNLGLVEVGLEGEVIMCNQSFEKLSGYSLAEIKGKEAASLFSEGADQIKLLQKNISRKEGSADSYEILARDKRGEARWWLISGATNYNDKGEITGSIGIHLDITDQKKLEKDLEEALYSAQQASQAKETFLANMSHEIRTPLNGILGMMEALKQEELNTEQKSFINSAFTASEHLLSVINNVLDITKIEAGELELINQSFSFDKLIKDVDEILKNQINKSKIEWILNVKDIDHNLIGDKIRLRQVLINVLGNAIKFTEKGFIKLCCKGEIPKNGKQKITIEIIDTGIGIEKAALDKIFLKFQQEDIGTSRKYGGTGLGLVIAKELVELMDGQISLTSTKGIGTQILIKLNLPIGEKSSQKEQNDFSEFNDFGGMTFLLVEDNDMNRMVVKQALSKMNVKIVEALNGKEAVDFLKTEACDLVLMDIQMPVMDGMEATTIIRKELKLELPIIALSANAFKTEIEACMEIGFNDYVIKPFGRNTLLKTINKHLSNMKSQNDSNNFEQEKLYNLKGLRSIAMDNEEFVERMINLFIELTLVSIKEIETCFEARDFEKLKKEAHKIKPSIDNMGITSARETIRNIEKFDIEKMTIQILESSIIDLKNTLIMVVEQLKKNEI